MRLSLTKACRSDLINPGVRHCNLAVRSPAFPWVPRHLARISPGKFGRCGVPSSLAEGGAKTRTKGLTSLVGILRLHRGFGVRGVRKSSKKLSCRTLGGRRVDGVGAYLFCGGAGGRDAGHLG